MYLRFGWICFLLVCSAALRAELPLITFQDDFAKYEGQQISIRGFLYQTADDRWILAAEPNLKSCCIGTEHKSRPQIQILGDFTKEHLDRVLTLQGLMSSDSRPLPQLLEASILPDPESGFCPLCFLSLFLLIGSVFVIYRVSC